MTLLLSNVQLPQQPVSLPVNHLLQFCHLLADRFLCQLSLFKEPVTASELDDLNVTQDTGQGDSVTSLSTANYKTSI